MQKFPEGGREGREGKGGEGGLAHLLFPRGRAVHKHLTQDVHILKLRRAPGTHLATQYKSVK